MLLTTTDPILRYFAGLGFWEWLICGIFALACLGMMIFIIKGAIDFIRINKKIDERDARADDLKDIDEIVVKIENVKRDNK